MENADDTVKKCCFTGYRPAKLPFDVNVKNKEYFDFENLVIDGILKLAEEGCSVFYSGMAMGFDIFCAECVLLLKKFNKISLKLVCVIPFKGQSSTFPKSWQERYEKILNECDEAIILSEEYFKGCYQKRNIFMVDNSDYVLTWFDGKAGGTKNTVDYAIKQNRFVLNLNNDVKKDFFPQTVFEIF